MAYNKKSVDQAIRMDPTISKKGAKAIHSLLKGNTGSKLKVREIRQQTGNYSSDK